MVLCFVLGGTSVATTEASATFDKFRALSGEWEGTVVWVGTHDAPAKISAHYHVGIVHTRYAV